MRHSCNAVRTTSKRLSASLGFCPHCAARIQAACNCSRLDTGGDCQRIQCPVPAISRRTQATTIRPPPRSALVRRVRRRALPSQSRLSKPGICWMESKSDVHCAKPACKVRSLSARLCTRSCVRAMPSTPRQVKPAISAITPMATNSSISVKPALRLHESFAVKATTSTYLSRSPEPKGGRRLPALGPRRAENWGWAWVVPIV